jgi:hypothetical protein
MERHRTNEMIKIGYDKFCVGGGAEGRKEKKEIALGSVTIVVGPQK